MLEEAFSSQYLSSLIRYNLAQPRSLLSKTLWKDIRSIEGAYALGQPLPAVFAILCMQSYASPYVVFHAKSTNLTTR